MGDTVRGEAGGRQGGLGAGEAAPGIRLGPVSLTRRDQEPLTPHTQAPEDDHLPSLRASTLSLPLDLYLGLQFTSNPCTPLLRQTRVFPEKLSFL